MSKSKLTPEQLEEKHKSLVKSLNKRLEYTVEALSNLQRQFNYFKETITCESTLTIYSADNECAINQTGNWHKIVCEYDSSGRCLGGRRNHWMSSWDIKSDGFHLKRFVDQDWKGWHGQYSKSELRYDELPRDVLALHHQALCEHLTKLSIWYPCHIYNDFTGELYRP